MEEKELCNLVISNRFDDVNEFLNDRKVATNNFSLEEDNLLQ